MINSRKAPAQTGIVMQLRQLGLFLASVMLAGSALADTLSLREGHSQRYVVQRGDTLWDISAAYYKNPWKYHRIAKYNHIKDPDYIISGTTITIPAQ